MNLSQQTSGFSYQVVTYLRSLYVMDILQLPNLYLVVIAGVFPVQLAAKRVNKGSPVKLRVWIGREYADGVFILVEFSA